MVVCRGFRASASVMRSGYWRNAGFRVVRQGKHITLSNGVVMVQVPRHTTINAYTMGYIARTAGLTPEQFRELP